MVWKKHNDRELTYTGGGFNYYFTIFSNGLKQIEIIEDTKYNPKTKKQVRTGDVAVNVGTREQGTSWEETIQGDYEVVMSYRTYKEALAFAIKRMKSNVPIVSTRK